MKRFICISILLAAVLASVSSCGETQETDDHANWKKRNSDYITEIASRCSDITPEAAQKGQLFRLLSFKLDPEQQWGNGSFVYCEVLEKGADTLSPNYTDSIRINYRLRLIPTDSYPEGQVIDRSFMTSSLDPSVNIPTSFRVSGLVDGVATAVMHMHCGDFWKLYVPCGLGYGNNTRNNIPGYSTLVFEINLTEIARPGQALSPR